MVPTEGVEPTHPYGYQILSLARLPIPPRRHSLLIRFLTELLWQNKHRGQVVRELENGEAKSRSENVSAVATQRN
jgi:hypothetical protein